MTYEINTKNTQTLERDSHKVLGNKPVKSVNLIDESGEEISVQHPLPTDGDSVYVKDIDLTNSDNGDFSGVVTDYFDSLKTVNNNVTSDNPKSIKIWFKRSTQSASIGFGCDDLTKSFSNIKISILGSGDAVRSIADESTNDTKYNSRVIDFPPEALNGVLIEFHTADAIGLSNLIIYKSINTIARLQGIDDTGVSQNVLTTVDGNLSISDNSSGLAIAKGDVTKHSNVSKFGQNSDLNTTTYEDIWDVGGTYPYPADDTAPITYIGSDDAADTEPIEVQGLDITGVLTVQTITLTGTTHVALTTPLWRLFRMKNNGTNDLIGSVHASNTADTVDYGHIDAGNNQTLMALYTIPLGMTGYLQQGTNSLVGTNKDYTVSGRMMMRPYGKVFQLKRTFGLQASGTSYMVMPFPVPGKIPALTDIKVSAISSAAGGGLNTTFELILVED